MFDGPSCDPVIACLGMLQPHEDPKEICFLRSPSDDKRVLVVDKLECPYCLDNRPVNDTYYDMQSNHLVFQLQCSLFINKYGNKLLSKGEAKLEPRRVQQNGKRLTFHNVSHLPAEMLCDRGVVKTFNIIWHTKYLILLLKSKSKDSKAATEASLKTLKLKAFA